MGGGGEVVQEVCQNPEKSQSKGVCLQWKYVPLLQYLVLGGL